jgi:chemotaxis protein methyltransferase CheR
MHRVQQGRLPRSSAAVSRVPTILLLRGIRRHEGFQCKTCLKESQIQLHDKSNHMTTGSQLALAKSGSLTASESIDPMYRQIRDLVYKASGIFQLEEKLYLLVDGCGRRMKHLGLASARDYWNLLSAASSRDAEMRELLNELTIGETCLFRSQPQLDALRKVIIPELVGEKVKQVTKRLRIWSAGCSTGEEPYTLAMNMMEESEGLLKGWTVEILATDLNDRSVEIAKAGIYGDYALRSTSAYYKSKYFTAQEGTKFQVRPEVKKLITFSRLNLQDDSKMLFMKGMDLIFCCNVLIYFDNPSKSKVVSHYFNNLNFGGYFFMGMSESLMKLSDQFHLVHFPGALAYWKPSLKSGKL